MTERPESAKPVVVTDSNQDMHLRRLERGRLRKERLRAADRRKNFELGETTGFLYFVGMLSIAITSSGQLELGDLGIAERLIIGLLGALALGGKTYIKRRFWKKTLDADWKEEQV